jgi:subtilase family serine protease
MNTKKFISWLAMGVCLSAGAAGPANADSVSVNFESPTYAVGDISGQDGWTKSGPYDAAVVSNTYGFGSFASQSLRISNSITSTTFGDQTFAKPLADAVGEADSTDGTFSAGTLQGYFEMQFDVASTVPTAQQPGLAISVSPDRGDGSRMSYLRFEDGPTGIDVYFDDVQGTSDPANFVETQIASGLDRTMVHTIKLTMNTMDGPSNDVVQVFIDGSWAHTGTSWENYYRYDSEAGAEPSPRIVKTAIFRAGGTGVPANAGNGFLFDNISLTSSAPPPPADLVIDSLTASPTLAAAGQSVNVSATIRNAGTGAAGNFQIDLYKDLAAAPTVSQSGDSTCNVSGLASGDTTTCSMTVSYSTAGSYNVWAQTDALNSVVESNENNNVKGPVRVTVRLPDLRITSLTAPAAPVKVGDPVMLTAIVANASPVDATAFAVDIYKDLAAAPGIGQVGDITCPVASLASRDSTVCSGTVTYSTAGTFKVWAQADSQNALGESDESNNLKGPVTVTVASPDLTVTSLSTPGGNVAAGQPVVLSATVTNNGTVAASAFAVDLYKDLAAAPVVSQVGDVTCAVGSLSAGASTTCSGSVTYAAAGTFSVWAQADTQNTVGETDEGNNVAGPASITVTTSADLVIDSLTATPYIVAVGEDVTLSATVRNAGSSPTGAFAVDLYKDQSGAPALGQTGDVTCNVAGLAAGETMTCTGTVTYSTGGYANVRAQVDTMNSVAETNEGNNVKGPVRVIVRLADLRVTSLVVPAVNVTVGQAVTLTATVANVSPVVATAFSVDLYKDLAAAPGVGQMGDITCAVSSLAPRETTTCTSTVTYSSTGTFQVWAQADTQNTLAEANEGNNLMGPRSVTVALPDLVISTLRTAPTKAATGQSVTLIATVYNAGGYAAANAFTIDLYKASAGAPPTTQAGDVTCAVASLASGGTTACKGVVTYDAAGSYQVWVRVDRSDANIESNEANNISGPVTVTIQ